MDWIILLLVLIVIWAFTEILSLTLVSIALLAEFITVKIKNKIK